MNKGNSLFNQTVLKLTPLLNGVFFERKIWAKETLCLCFKEFPTKLNCIRIDTYQMEFPLNKIKQKKKFSMENRGNQNLACIRSVGLFLIKWSKIIFQWKLWLKEIPFVFLSLIPHQTNILISSSKWITNKVLNCVNKGIKVYAREP